MYATVLQDTEPGLIPARIHELCPFCLHSGTAIRGGGDHFLSLACACPDVRTLGLAVLHQVESHMRTLADSTTWASFSRPAFTLPAADQPTLPILSAVGWMLHSPLEVEALARLARHTAPEDAIWSLGWRGGTTPLWLRYSSLPLSTEEVQELEWCKVKAVDSYCGSLESLFQEACAALCVPQDAASPPVLAPAAVPLPTHNVLQACIVPGCLAPAVQLLRCSTHAETHRVHVMSSLIRSYMTTGPLLGTGPTPFSVNDFLFPATVADITRDKLRGIREDMRLRGIYARSRDPSQTTCTSAIRSTLFPFRQPDSPVGVWPGYTARDLICLCVGSPHKNKRYQLDTSTAHTCATCSLVRIVTPLQRLAPLTQALCASCDAALSLPPLSMCSCCLRPRHDPLDPLLRPPCLAPACPAPIGAPWICPSCQLLLTRANCVRSRGTATTPSLLPVVSLVPPTKRTRALPAAPANPAM